MDLKGRNREQFLYGSQESILCDIVENDCSLTLEQLSGGFLSATNIRISKNTVARYLKQYNYSFKKIKFIPERRNIAGTIQERSDYVIKYLIYSASNRFILFMDETGFNVSMRRN
ncbi:hypothetical protein RF11_05777 [Thelohanellus kitauei]|uniref:Tc1-like transposase DDE domain-containing protein n=1 Tax=Thelohanellus kitauei TaxID=669202 RepID=A0A0C2JVW6_THEKT|nr:hypothetical protein RF11_05777 [Thelohanellus kitauei]